VQHADAVIHAGFSLDRKAFTPEEITKAGEAEQDNVRTFIETLSGTAKTLIVTIGGRTTMLRMFRDFASRTSFSILCRHARNAGA
jgi:hypothetical protein